MILRPNKNMRAQLQEMPSRFRRLALGLIATLPSVSLLSFSPISKTFAQDFEKKDKYLTRIAIGKFVGDLAGEANVSAIITVDLQRSGLFRVISVDDVVPDVSAIDQSFWRTKGADILLAGALRQVDGRIEVKYRLYDTITGGMITGSMLNTKLEQSRNVAHWIADDVLEKIGGGQGPFATRIAYVVRGSDEYRIEIADTDGANQRVAISSKKPIMSPKWSPDGSRIAYVSFESSKPVVHVQELSTGKRLSIANYKGSNSAPTWSPDNRRLAFALASDGLSKIFSINADGTDIKKLSINPYNDTEPCYSPDGKSLFFTSDRDGTLQIYKMDIDGNNILKLPLTGSYNISPSISPNGQLLAFISHRDGRFQLYVLELESGREIRLSDGPRDRSPSFAPNSRYIMYANQSRDLSHLAIVAVDGSSRYALESRGYAIHEPAWGPFQK
jgi:TolB protein